MLPCGWFVISSVQRFPSYVGSIARRMPIMLAPYSELSSDQPSICCTTRHQVHGSQHGSQSRLLFCRAC